MNVAWDRYRLLRSVRRLADRGELVICDRYPSVTVGAVDSPRLKLWTGEERTSPIVRALYNRIVQLEHALYRRMPDPDVVIRLTVSLEIAKQRNRNRGKRIRLMTAIWRNGETKPRRVRLWVDTPTM
ncbi:MAG: hypothetical protein R2932_57700 [Caldilineaceae bacterium]